MSKKIYIIAGEPSGDFIGSKLISQLNESQEDITIKFIGGDLMEKQMQAQSIKSLFPISQIAIMGFLEVISKIFTIKKLMKDTIEDIKKFQPDMLITIDSLGFNGRIVKELKKLHVSGDSLQNTKFVHYVAPTVWAWKPKRAEELAKLYDYLLCLFDFEIPYFVKHGLKTFSVGHPIIESGADKGNKEDLIKKYNLDEQKTYILLMAGSRMGEVSRLLPIFMKVANNLQDKYKNIGFIIPTLSHLKDYVEKSVATDLQNALVITEHQEKYDAFNLSKLAIVASGTATLELSLAQVPAVVGYKVNWLTSKIAGLLIKIKYASIINIIANKEIIKEFIQERCTVDNLTKASIHILNNLEKENFEKNNTKVFNILKELGYNNFTPSLVASEIIIDILNNKK
jgi:lipid-A-disaccharide synthase